MGKNIKGGSKHKKYARQREFIIDLNINNFKKNNDQEYAFVSKILGNCKFELICFDGKKRLGCLRGNMKKRKWVNKGDCILVSLRDFQDAKCDIILVYKSEQVDVLIKKKEITSMFSQEGLLENDNDNENEMINDTIDFETL